MSFPAHIHSLLWEIAVEVKHPLLLNCSEDPAILFGGNPSSALRPTVLIALQYNPVLDRLHFFTRKKVLFFHPTLILYLLAQYPISNSFSIYSKDQFLQFVAEDFLQVEFITWKERRKTRKVNTYRYIISKDDTTEKLKYFGLKGERRKVIYKSKTTTQDKTYRTKTILLNNRIFEGTMCVVNAVAQIFQNASFEWLVED